MKKDLQSYKKHDIDFNSDSNNLENTTKVLAKYDAVDQFKILGFELALQLSNPLPVIHVDVGSGNGWLLNKMAPYFEKSIGIEPSEKAIVLATEINKRHANVSFINKDMIDGLDALNPTSPIFVTSSTVLNHIENYYVQDFLKKIDTLPLGSIVFFDERYDENIDWNMWHVRSKDWWRSNLPSWQVVFFDINAAAYPSGIYGIKTSKEKKLPTITMGTSGKVAWFINKIYNLIKRVVIKLAP